MKNQHQSDPLALVSDLGRKYGYIREKHDRESAKGSTRRRLKQDMERVAQRFEHLLGQWIQDEGQREAWRRHVYHRAAEPQEVRLGAPTLFKGRTESGALLEIKPAAGGAHDVFMDGTRVDHRTVPLRIDMETLQPIYIGDWVCQEVFAAPAQALAAIEGYLSDPAATPLGAWARILYEDGLVDANLALTPRGARCLKRGSAPAGNGKRANFCVVLAAGAHARVLTLTSATPKGTPTLAALKEAVDLHQPEPRARDSDQYSDTRPGLQQASAKGSLHAVSDRREGHRRDKDRHFIERVAEEAARIWKRLDPCDIVAVAGPRVLGVLRPALQRHVSGPRPLHLVTFAHDLTSASPPAVHDALAKAGLLPARKRRPPLMQMRTPNPWQG